MSSVIHSQLALGSARNGPTGTFSLHNKSPSHEAHRRLVTEPGLRAVQVSSRARARVRPRTSPRGAAREGKPRQLLISSLLPSPASLPPSRLIRPAQTPPRKEATWRRRRPRPSTSRPGGRGGWGRRSGPPSSASYASYTSSRSVNLSFGSQSHRFPQDPTWEECIDQARRNARKFCSFVFDTTTTTTTGHALRLVRSNLYHAWLPATSSSSFQSINQILINSLIFL